MPVINKGTSFSNGEQLTASKLNNSLDLASFDTSAVDNDSTFVNSSGQIIVRDDGITTPKIASGAVNFSKLNSSLVIDDDTMATASSTTLATSESIKAFVNQSQSKFVSLTGGTTDLTKTNETTTATYNINDFTSDDIDFDFNNITALIVEATVNAKVADGGANSQENIIQASLPNGSDTILVKAISQFVFTMFSNKIYSGQRSATTTTIPINPGQSSFTLTYDIENQGPSTFSKTVIKGAILN